MARFALTIEYDGSPFCGWQRQPQGDTVQGALEDAVAKLQPSRVTVHGAGRTDAGVHALAQVAHIDLDRDWEPFRLSEALNFHLKPRPISIVACRAVPDTFDARFSAIQRHYVYRILNRRAPTALLRQRVWRVSAPLDHDGMHRAAQAFIGHHDFTTFRAAQCQAASPEKTLDAFMVRREGAEIVFSVSARSFLHSQVRSMVGSLKCVGEGRWPVSRIADALAARDRTACGPIAPADGLYLERVDYPAAAFEAAQTGH